MKYEKAAATKNLNIKIKQKKKRWTEKNWNLILNLGHS